MNVTLWIRDPFPFHTYERDALQEALRRTYGSLSLVYRHEWPVDIVCIDNVNITTCKQIANTLKAFHLQSALLDKQHRGYDRCRALEIAIQKPEDGKPNWAQEA
jgi:hypothetical protein